MKKLMIVLLLLIFFSSTVLINTNPATASCFYYFFSVLLDTGGVQQGQELLAQNLSHLNMIVQQKQQEMEQQITQNMDEETKLTIQNQNRVRLAVHSLLAMENLIGGIGENVSAVAREFNNSIQATIRAEERIERRSGFTRFFAGGDEVAAEEIEQEMNRNQERIQQLRGLMNSCDCSPEIKNRFEEQIQKMEQEQNRQRVLAQAEKQSKGLFGWLWK